MSSFKLADSLQKITILHKGPYCEYQRLAGNYYFMAKMYVDKQVSLFCWSAFD